MEHFSGGAPARRQRAHTERGVCACGLHPRGRRRCPGAVVRRASLTACCDAARLASLLSPRACPRPCEVSAWTRAGAKATLCLGSTLAKTARRNRGCCCGAPDALALSVVRQQATHYSALTCARERRELHLQRCWEAGCIYSASAGEPHLALARAGKRGPCLALPAGAERISFPSQTTSSA
jgi:hypothetical protein